jgi:hypothetical protein
MNENDLEELIKANQLTMLGISVFCAQELFFPFCNVSSRGTMEVSNCALPEIG